MKKNLIVSSFNHESTVFVKQEQYKNVIYLKIVELVFIIASVILYIKGHNIKQIEIVIAFTYMTCGAFILFNILFIISPESWKRINVLLVDLLGIILFLLIGMATLYSTYNIQMELKKSELTIHKNGLMRNVIYNIWIYSYLKGCSGACCIISAVLLLLETRLLSKEKNNNVSNENLFSSEV